LFDGPCPPRPTLPSLAGMVRTFPDGVPSWVDSEYPDLEAAQTFYGELWGWTFDTATPPGFPFPYVIARLGGRDVAGLAQLDPDRSNRGQGFDGPAWNTYIAVDDADEAVNRIVSAGGELVRGPDLAGEGGRSASCLDPAGTPFRLWEAKRRPGVQVANQPGSWNFSDLHTNDLERVARFYTEVFGWSFDEMGFAMMIRRPGYGDHLESTVDPGIRARQADAPPGFADAIGWVGPADDDSDAHWHVSFAVADRDESAAKAESLGAVVLSTEESEWTRTALVRDPQGAVFTASEFAPPESASSFG
jgi:predicted enzyme related to lactoylglutathione lyase